MMVNLLWIDDIIRLGLNIATLNKQAITPSLASQVHFIISLVLLPQTNSTLHQFYDYALNKGMTTAG
jgi:hypothetical protein